MYDIEKPSQQRKPMKTLLSLTSVQTLPNVLFAKEQSDWDRYVFISTELMEKQSVSQDSPNENKPSLVITQSP